MSTRDTRLGFGGGRQLGTPYAAYTTPFLSPLFAPCQQPPYGEIAAIDLRTRSVIWRRPLGSANELGPAGSQAQVGHSYGRALLRRHRRHQRRVGVHGRHDGSPLARARAEHRQGTLERCVAQQCSGHTDELPVSADRKQYVVIAVPATATADDSHVAEPEAQRRSQFALELLMPAAG